jgi:hypothetical protein
VPTLKEAVKCGANECDPRRLFFLACLGGGAGLHNTAVFGFFSVSIRIRNTEYGGSVNGGSVAAVKPTILLRIERRKVLRCYNNTKEQTSDFQNYY